MKLKLLATTLLASLASVKSVALYEPVLNVTIFNVTKEERFSILQNATLPFIPAPCFETRYRPNIHTMDKGDLQVFFDAMKKVRAEPHPNHWDNLVLIHDTYFDLVHNHTQFLAWHRVFLYQMEMILREVNDTIRIPYWDWTVYSQSLKDDPVFSDQMMGGQGVLNTEPKPLNEPEWGCVKDGQFKDSMSYYVAKNRGEHRPHCIQRGHDFFNKTLACPQIIDLDLLANKNITQFSLEFEAGPHNIVHDLIGGEFGVHVSANDPLFYIHHSFIDKLWFDWGQIHNSNEFPGDNVLLSPWNVTSKQVADSDSLCIKYEQDHFLWQNRTAWNPERRKAVELIMELRKMDPNLPSTNFSSPQYEVDRLFRHDFTGPVDKTKLAIPNPLSEETIIKNHLNRTMVRELEARYAQLVTKLNQISDFESEAAPAIISKQTENYAPNKVALP